jgi:hypothetical protein
MVRGHAQPPLSCLEHASNEAFLDQWSWSACRSPGLAIPGSRQQQEHESNVHQVCESRRPRGMGTGEKVLPPRPTASRGERRPYAMSLESRRRQFRGRGSTGGFRRTGQAGRGQCISAVEQRVAWEGKRETGPPGASAKETFS